MGCQRVPRPFDTQLLLVGHPPQPKGPSDFTRAFKQSMIMCAYNSLPKSYFFYSASLYEPL